MHERLSNALSVHSYLLYMSTVVMPYSVFGEASWKTQYEGDIYGRRGHRHFIELILMGILMYSKVSGNFYIINN